MSRAIIFDVDGVLIHGYHARPERQVRWDQNLLEDLGVDPGRFRTEFIFDIFVKKVIVGEMALIEALERRLPSLGFTGSPMRFAQYWLAKDSTLNHDLLGYLRPLRASSDLQFYIATNQEHMRALWLWQVLGLHEIFHDIFYSARIGCTKARPEFFKFVDMKIGPQSEPPLFFDDTAKVVDTATACGWEAVLFDTTEDFLNHRYIDDRLKRTTPHTSTPGT
ncbi:haloacid dehalogenase [Devosia pacifica]|uniref:Haloacid dehalogenase n=1 Tax=Devosia pacifica TaxID=1335967 RepID=A0A918RX19_9HYPH|nr:HAD family hydrolase [Devosia pacifica]GHA14310.1 haloacid dehalogenase [Devosia pacifica]